MLSVLQEKDPRGSGIGTSLKQLSLSLGCSEGVIPGQGRMLPSPEMFRDEGYIVCLLPDKEASFTLSVLLPHT